MRIPHWDYLSWARDRFGARTALLGYPRVLATNKTCIHMNRRPVYLRVGTSDLQVWKDIFVGMEYAVAVKGEPKFIIDAGAFIGLSPIWWAMRYPEALIVAVELDAENFKMLKLNTEHYPNIHPIHAGLWSHQTMLEVENPGAATWSFRATEGGTVPGITVQQIMADYGYDRVDLLKIDIEGGEKEVLQHAGPWRERFGTLVIETHDRYVRGCTEALRDAMAGLPLKHSVSGENVVLTRY